MSAAGTDHPFVALQQSFRLSGYFGRAREARGTRAVDLGCAKTLKGGQRRGIAFPLRPNPSANEDGCCKSLAIRSKAVLRLRNAVAFSRDQDSERTLWPLSAPLNSPSDDVDPRRTFRTTVALLCRPERRAPRPRDARLPACRCLLDEPSSAAKPRRDRSSSPTSTRRTSA